jgi:hypothetical protein
VSAERVWSAWLDTVETAARAVEQQALDREAPELAVLPMPGVPWPAALEGRRREVLAALAAATATVERCRDETGAALARLAHAPTRPTVADYTEGSALDVLG